MSYDQDNTTFQYFDPIGAATGVTFDPNNFRIDAGVASLGSGSFRYVYTGREYPGGLVIVFTSDTVPQLGDTVVNSVLVPREKVANPARDVFQEEWPEPIINNEPGFQGKRTEFLQTESWPDKRSI